MKVSTQQEVRLAVVNRRALSLIEIMVVIALLSLATGFTGFHATRAMAHHRYLGSSDAIVSRVALAAQAALHHDVDLVLEIDGEPGSLRMKVVAGGNLPTHCKAHLEKPIRLKEIAKITFNGAEEPPLRLVFAAGGKKCPKGLLTLEPRRATEEPRRLFLPGYPARIIALKSGALAPIVDDEVPRFPEEAYASTI